MLALKLLPWTARRYVALYFGGICAKRSVICSSRFNIGRPPSQSTT
jgi:hypothetical protein